MKTIILDGIEYALVPRDQLEPVPQSQPKIEALSDFVSQETTQEPEDNIQIVDSRSFEEIGEATPKESEYRKRFKAKKLLPQDVIGFAGMNRGYLDSFEDVDVIEADNRKPNEKRMFYGPGIESDSGSVV